MNASDLQIKSTLNAAQPIGVFDSGIGGLSVLDNLSKVLPQERFIYLADTAYVPYGEKSPEFLKQRVAEIFDWFIQVKQVKAIVLACNTSCRFIPERLSVPVLDPISVASQMAKEMTAIHKMGVIATIATVDGGLYQKQIELADQSKMVYQSKAVNLVNLIESAQMQTQAAQDCLQAILSPLAAKQIEALVLGCTHYPFAETEIKAVLKSLLGYDIPLLDPADGMGVQLKAILETQALINQKPLTSASHVIYTVTGQPEVFQQRAASLPLQTLQVNAVSQVDLHQSTVTT